MPQPSPIANLPLPARPPRAWPFALALSLLCFAVRIPALLALPIFGDEAIYLRWAQLVRAGYPWVSICDPKPPLHFWLIAAVMNLTANPLYAARFLSVLAGVLAIPLVLAICNELVPLARPPTSQTTGRLAAILAAVFMIFCPFLAFYQRFATADALFVTESLAAVFLSLRWARQLSLQQNSWPAAILLALTLGLALLTRQGLSYTLCLLPPFALFLQFLRTRQSPIPARKFPLPRALLQLAVTALLALLLWSPYLFADLHQYAINKEHSPAQELKERILYKSDFTDANTSRLDIAERNFELTFLPDSPVQNGKAPPTPTKGWLYYYLTPSMFFIALIALAYLLFRRHVFLFAFLAAWLALMLIPPILLGNVIFSRYVLAAVPPLLIAAAFFLSDFLAFLIARKLSPVLVWSAFALFLAGLLFSQLIELATQIKAPDLQTLTAQDRYQYLTGWTAGGPTTHAIEALNRLAAKRPIVVLTGSGSGTPADAAWVYLSKNPNITLYYKDLSADGPLLLTPASPDSPDTYLLRKNKFLFTKPEPVVIPENTPVYLIVNDPLYAGNIAVPANSFFRNNNPNIGPPTPFYGVDGQLGSDHVDIFPVH